MKILVAIDEQFQNIDKWSDNFGNRFALINVSTCVQIATHL